MDEGDTAYHVARKYFRLEVQRMIDYVGSDLSTARGARQGYVFHHIAFVPDHSTVMQSYDMWDEDWNADEKRCRTQQKPIGWQIKQEHAQKWNDDDDLQNMMQEWTPAWKYVDLANVMKHTKRYGANRAQRRGMPRHTETMTERKLRDELHTARKQQQRTQVCRRLWQARRTIRAERQRQRRGQVLTHLGQGGLGKRDIMKVPLGLTTTLHNDDGTKTTAQQEIAAKATAYYSALLGPLQYDEAEDTGYGVNMHEFLNGEYDLREWCIGVTSENATAALSRCPSNKTTGRDEITI